VELVPVMYFDDWSSRETGEPEQFHHFKLNGSRDEFKPNPFLSKRNL